MFPFGRAILCKCVGTGNSVRNPFLCEVFAESLEFASPIRLKTENFVTELFLYPKLEISKYGENITLQF